MLLHILFLLLNVSIDLAYAEAPVLVFPWTPLGEILTVSCHFSYLLDLT